MPPVCWSVAGSQKWIVGVPSLTISRWPSWVMPQPSVLY